MNGSDRLSAAVVRERAASLASEAMHAVALQVRRLASEESEDSTFALRWWADLQFLVVALRRLRRAADLGEKADNQTGSVRAAIADFDAELPTLAVMRNVGEHVDDYALDSPKRRHKAIDRRQLQVGTWDGRSYRWLRDDNGQWLELDVRKAKEVAENLYAAIRKMEHAADSTVPEVR